MLGGDRRGSRVARGQVPLGVPSRQLTTDRVENAGLWMRVDANDGGVLVFDNIWDRRIGGTTDWAWHGVVLDVPDTAALVAFGVKLVWHERSRSPLSRVPRASVDRAEGLVCAQGERGAIFGGLVGCRGCVRAME